ncbi:hypothetical protein BOX15_Mlig015574g3 [Macrostomum lignano]|uniref:Sec1 family domain-containing protein 2 n=1 Tax=Macrostomum lignano TaxID=282301 RepID=A0A267EA27_9PLAT|nr:hypothetical protein BOX15_Mlig015574g3 [Macrostomum lignano]
MERGDKNKPTTALVDPAFVAEVGNNLVKQAQELTGGDHILVIDPSLMKPLDRVTTGAQLRKQMAAEVQSYRDGRIEHPPESARARFPILYLLRPDLRRLRQVCNAFKADSMRGVRRLYLVAFLPAVPAGAHALAEEEGVLGQLFQLHDLPLLLFPLDEDLLSMELDSAFRCLQSDGDRSVLASVARAIVSIEHATRPAGPAPHWHLFGESALAVFALCEHLRSGSGSSAAAAAASGPGGFSQVIIFSREVDLITPLCLQRLYAGCLDDCFRVTSGLLVVPRSNAAASSEPGQQQQQQQPSRLFVSRLEDPVFRCLSDLHMAAVPDTLRQVAHSLTSFEQHGRSAKSVAEMRSFVQNDLRDLTFKKRSLASHITLCEEVNKRFNGLKEFLHAEECMLIGADPTDASMRQSIGMRNYYADYFAECCVRRADPRHTLRLMCLHSLACGGFSVEDLSRLRQAFCQAFGYQHVATFAALHKAGLLTPRDKVGHVASVTGGRQSALSSAAVPPSSASAAANASMDYPALRKRLQLVERDPASAEQDSSRLSYAMSGLCEPLSGKLIQLALESGKGRSNSQQSQPSLNNLPFYKHQTLAQNRYAVNQSALVVMLGGCTYSEVASVRQIASRCKVGIQLLTTGVVGCCDLLVQLCPTLAVPVEPPVQGDRA